ncbi:MAG: hypothetical protein IPK29_07250 [Betaproteobacteria bacterium]|nr:hypothetical protein [Betaproteobacteria bacterium]
MTNTANFHAGSNAITLTNAAANNFGNLTLAGGTVSVTEDSATNWVGSSSAASLLLTSNGAVTQTAGATLAVTNTANFQAGSNAITLTNAAANNFGNLTLAGWRGVGDGGFGDELGWSSSGEPAADEQRGR